MIGIPKEVVLKDLHEVLAKAMEETGDFDAENYIFVFCPRLYSTMEIWLISENQLENQLDISRRYFSGVEITVVRRNTNYFYLKYRGYPTPPITPEIEPIYNLAGSVIGHRIKKIEKIFAPTETIKKYIQVDDDDD